MPKGVLKFSLLHQGPQWPGPLAALGLGLLIVTGLFWTEIADAVAIWTNSAAHRFSFLIPPISLYILWLRRQEVAAMAPAPFLRGVWLAVPLCLLWVLADVAHVAAGKHLAIMGFIQVLLVTALGPGVYRALLFPFLYLWLMVPAGDFLIPALMEVTTDLTVWGVELFGIDVRREGFVIRVPYGAYQIIAACAAFDFLIGSLAISLFYGQLLYRGWRKRLLCIAVALAGAVLANNIRTVSIIVMMEWTEGRSDLASQHLTYGWYLFAFSMFFLMALGWFFRDKAETEPPALTGLPEGNLNFGGGRALCAVLLVALVAGAGKAYAASLVSDAGSPAVLAVCAPSQTGSWAVGGNESDWRPRLAGADGELFETFASGDRQVDLYVGYLWRQRQGAEVAGWGIRRADGKTWFPVETTSAAILLDGERQQIEAYRLRAKGKRRRLVWQFYWVDDTFTGSPIVAKLLSLKSALLGGEPRAAYLAISSEEVAGRTEAAESLKSFLDGGASIKTILEAVKARSDSCAA